MGIALLFLRYAWPFLLIGGLYLWADEGWDSARAKRAEKRADVAEQQIATAQKRATDLALLWSAQVTKTEQAVKEQRDHDAATAATLESRSRALPDLPSIRLSDATVRLFGDASTFANAAAPPAAVDPGATAPVPAAAEAQYSEQAFGEFVTESAAAYRDAYGKWAGCVDFYNQLRSMP